MKAEEMSKRKIPILKSSIDYLFFAIHNNVIDNVEALVTHFRQVKKPKATEFMNSCSN